MTDEQIMKALCPIMGWEYKNILGPCGEMDGKIYFPLENANHRDMVVEQMRELGWYCKITYYKYIVEVEFWKVRGNSYVESHDEPGYAVCLAALKALEEA